MRDCGDVFNAHFVIILLECEKIRWGVRKD